MENALSISSGFIKRATGSTNDPRALRWQYCTVSILLHTQTTYRDKTGGYAVRDTGNDHMNTFDHSS